MKFNSSLCDHVLNLMWPLCPIRRRYYAKKINADHSKGLSTVLGSGIWLNYSAGFKKMQNFLTRYRIWPLLGKQYSPKSWHGIQHWEKTVLWDRDDRSSGCGTIMKNELECGIRTPLTVLIRLRLWPYHYFSVKFILPMG